MNVKNEKLSFQNHCYDSEKQLKRKKEMKRKRRNKDWVDYLVDGTKLMITGFAVFALPSTLAELVMHDFATTFWMLASLAWLSVGVIKEWVKYEND